MASRRQAQLVLRPATEGDADLLLAWANAPSTRAASFRPEPIPADAHGRWFAERLASPLARLLIGFMGDAPVGLLRLEVDPDGAIDIGISIAEGARGRGLGRSLLSVGLHSVRDDPAFAGRSLVARVRVDNAVSIGLFRGAGFELRERSVWHGVPCLVFELASR